MRSGGVLARDPVGDGLFLAVVAALMPLFSVVNTLSVLDEHRRRGERLPFWEPLLWETSSIAMWLALSPLIMGLTRRIWPLSRPWWRAFGVHAAALAGISLAHVGGMGALRWIGYAAAGRAYPPTGPLNQFLYEFRKDALVYAGLVTLYMCWRLYRQRAAPSPPVAAEPALEVRDGARRHFVPLAEIAYVEAAGNYVELHRGTLPILHRASLSALERDLAGAGFVRIHRARLVRRGAVARVDSRSSGDFVVTLSDGRQLAGSRRYRRPLLEPRA